jgi:transcriptional regulator with XRE-family HTH domain
MDEQAQQQLGERIHILRRRRGLTSAALAKQVGTARATISRLENTRKPQVSFDLLIRIADVLGVSLDYLAGRKETEKVETQPPPRRVRRRAAQKAEQSELFPAGVAMVGA